MHLLVASARDAQPALRLTEGRDAAGADVQAREVERLEPGKAVELRQPRVAYLGLGKPERAQAGESRHVRQSGIREFRPGEVERLEARQLRERPEGDVS